MAAIELKGRRTEPGERTSREAGRIRFTAFAEVAAAFRAQVKDGWIRGYLSTAFECPYAGLIDPARTAEPSARPQPRAPRRGSAAGRPRWAGG